MEDSNTVNHAAEIVTHITAAVSSLQNAVKTIETAQAPSHAELYLLARLDIAMDLLSVELPVTDQVEEINFTVEADAP
jgi:hypothetical protein